MLPLVVLGWYVVCTFVVFVDLRLRVGCLFVLVWFLWLGGVAAFVFVVFIAYVLLFLVFILLTIFVLLWFCCLS